MEGAGMRAAILSGAQGQKAVFDGANLSNSRMSRGNFSNASLEECDLWASHVSGTVFTQANIKAANLMATGLSKKFTLEEFPDIEFSNKTKWDNASFKRVVITKEHAKTIETEVKRRSFFSRLFS